MHLLKRVSRARIFGTNNEYISRARVLYPFRFLRYSGPKFVLSPIVERIFSSARAPDARIGRAAASWTRVNWRNRNRGLRGIGCASVTRIAIFVFPFLRLPSNVRGFFCFSFDWNEEVVGERRRMYIWNSWSILALPTYPRIPFVFVFLTNAS